MFVLESQTNHFIGVLLIIFLAATQGRTGRAGSFWLICYALPGTILHELTHFLVALVTGGRPCGFSIIPRQREGVLSDGSTRRVWVLGSVSLGNAGIFSAVPTAIAPLGLIVIAWFLYRHWFSWFPADTSHTIFLYLVIYLFCYSAIPSRQDLKIAFSSFPGILLYGGLAGLFICFYCLKS